jgi:hypothetical protein
VRRLEATMRTKPSWNHGGPFPECLSALLAIIAMVAAGFSVSCGGGSTVPKLTGNTQVTLVLTGTANDQWTEFDLVIQTLTLTNRSGNTVNLLSAPQNTEFIHLNGGIEPLVTVTIPQDVYVSATATVGNAGFSCLTLTPMGGVDTGTFTYGQTPTANVIVNLDSPITVMGNTMALALNLLAAQSASLSSCYIGNGNATFAITPTFNLAPTTFAPQSTSPANGKAFELNGQVSSIDTANNSFVLAYPESENPRTVAVSTGAGTEYQGINSFAGLTVGTFVDMDGAIQTDGSISATRIAVEDPNATSVVTGPVLSVSDAQPSLFMWGRQQQGALFAGIHVIGAQAFSFGNATFQVSGQLANLNSLPFTPSFTAATMVPGQNVSMTSTSDNVNGGFPYTPLSTMTLMPQTIDGTVSGTSSGGNFTVYTVNLASYDVFPTFAVQAGQTTLLNNPSEIEVYVDSSTQMLNAQTLAANGTFRFYGLVFNDHGTLRMDCAQVNDGVPFTANANMAVARGVKGRVTVLSDVTVGPLRATNVRITAAR